MPPLLAPARTGSGLPSGHTYDAAPGCAAVHEKRSRRTWRRPRHKCSVPLGWHHRTEVRFPALEDKSRRHRPVASRCPGYASAGGPKRPVMRCDAVELLASRGQPVGVGRVAREERFPGVPGRPSVRGVVHALDVLDGASCSHQASRPGGCLAGQTLTSRRPSRRRYDAHRRCMAPVAVRRTRGLHTAAHREPRTVEREARANELLRASAVK